MRGNESETSQDKPAEAQQATGCENDSESLKEDAAATQQIERSKLEIKSPGLVITTPMALLEMKPVDIISRTDQATVFANKSNSFKEKFDRWEDALNSDGCEVYVQWHPGKDDTVTRGDTITGIGDEENLLTIKSGATIEPDQLIAVKIFISQTARILSSNNT